MSINMESDLDSFLGGKPSERVLWVIEHGDPVTYPAIIVVATTLVNALKTSLPHIEGCTRYGCGWEDYYRYATIYPLSEPIIVHPRTIEVKSYSIIPSSILEDKRELLNRGGHIGRGWAKEIKHGLRWNKGED